MTCGTREAWLPIFPWFVSSSATWSVVLPASVSPLGGQSGCVSGTGVLPGQLAYSCWFTIWFLCLWVYEEARHSCFSLGSCSLLPSYDLWRNLRSLRSLSLSRFENWSTDSKGEKVLRTNKLCNCMRFISLESQDSKSFLKFIFH